MPQMKPHYLSQMTHANYQYRLNDILARFNTIAIQATGQMVGDNEAVGLSRVHMYDSKCILPLRENCIFCS